MKRLAMLVSLVMIAATLAACGRGADEPEVPTPVAVYTRSTEGADAVAQTEGDSAEAEPTEAEATDSEAVGAEVDEAEEAAATDATQPAATPTTAADTPVPAATEPSEAAGDDGIASAQEEEPEAAAAEEPEPTAPAEPTATPEPTATAEPTATPEPTATAEPTPTVAATATPTEAAVAAEDAGEFAGIPDEVASLIPNADIVRGEQLSLQNACIGCHNLNPDVPMAGPTWYNMAETAATRVEGESAAAYLYNSIIHPNDYIVDGYAAGIMLQTYEQTLSAQDLADIIGYLLTLREE